MRKSGSEGGSGKRAGGNADTAPRPDPASVTRHQGGRESRGRGSVTRHQGGRESRLQGEGVQ